MARLLTPRGSDDVSGAAKKRVVVVDDSRSMRALIARALNADSRLDVVGEAADAYEAREVIKRVSPDVITLDVEMPGMSGLAFLERLMRLRPMPVVMFSSETHAGSAAAVEALSMGAVDCVGKPVSLAASGFTELSEKVFIAACAQVRSGGAAVLRPRDRTYFWGGRAVLVGASTGGVEALERVLCGLPVNTPPVLITQHMPEKFLESFAARLAARLPMKVAVAEEGEEIRQGHIYLAPGGRRHLQIGGPPGAGVCRLVAGELRNGHRPSVDILFESALSFADRVVAVLLTGMGRDGAQGMLALRQSGAHTIAQDEASCVVYGMPRVANEIGAVAEVVPLDGVANAILDATGRMSSELKSPGHQA